MEPQNIQTQQWDLQTETKSKQQIQFKLVKAFQAHLQRIHTCGLNMNENLFFTNGCDKKWKLWDRTTGKAIMLLKTDGVICFAFNHPLCNHIAIGSFDSDVKVFDIATRKCQELVGHNGWVSRILFHPNCQLVATGSWDYTARLWNGKTGKQIMILSGHTRLITSLHFNTNGDKLLTCSFDTTARIWDVESGDCLNILGEHRLEVECGQFDQTGDYCATGSADWTYKIWNVKSGQCIQTLTGHEGKILSICFNSNGSRLVTVSSDHTGRISNIETGECTSELIGFERRITNGHYIGKSNYIFIFGISARIYSEEGECLQILSSCDNQMSIILLAKREIQLQVHQIMVHVKFGNVSTNDIIYKQYANYQIKFQRIKFTLNIINLYFHIVPFLLFSYNILEKAVLYVNKT